MVGRVAGMSNTTGFFNAFFGDNAGRNNTIGSNNTFIGGAAGINNLTGSFNVFVGNSAGRNELGSHKLYIQNNGSSAPLIYGDFGTSPLVGINGDLGVGTQMPLDKLHVLNGNLRIEQTGATEHALLNFVANGNTWEIKQNKDTGRLTFFSPSCPAGCATTAAFKFDRKAQENLLRVGVVAKDIVDINGDLMVSGSVSSNPDYVFTPEYALESIEDHAAYMWENKHLPAVGKGQVNAQGHAIVKVGARSQGVLAELEKAHIYIDQLHGQIAQNEINKEAQLEALKGQVTALEEKVAEMEALKTLVEQLMKQKHTTTSKG